MKILLACLAILAAFSVAAQTETSNFPYNPDSDGDGLIGVSDLVNLLGYYETQFNVSAQLNADSTSAIYFSDNWTSTMPRTNCEALCASLPGPWHVISSRGFAEHFDVIADSVGVGSFTEEYWQLDFGALRQFYDTDGLYPSIRFYTLSTGLPRGYGWNVNESTYCRCLCELRQRPRVEYDFCEGDMGSIQPCAAEKVSQGWYPLELTSTMTASGAAVYVQTFWRWED